MNAVLPEITEADATGVTAKIYEDIRQCLHVKNVNLIYRYFATIDGVLPWVWRVIKPHFASGELQKYSQASRSLYQTNFLRTATPTSTRLTEVERKGIADILDFYLTTNPINLFALQILNRAFAVQHIESSHPQNQLLPVTRIRQAAATRQFDSTSHELMFYVSQGLDHIRPTLLRQLADWPEYVNSIAEFVRTLSCEGDFENQTNSIYEYAARETSSFDFVQTMPLPSVEALEEIELFCHYFPRILIRMTVIANRLRMML